MKNSKKAFTLVELLVVIAILAVLASVSIIGYTAFTKKAVQNNAVSELTQVKTLVTGGATTDEDGYVVKFDDTHKFAFSFSDSENKYKFETSSDDHELLLSDEAKLTGEFTFDETNQKISYKLTSGSNSATVTWDLATGEIK